jgi:hypothetical protein
VNTNRLTCAALLAPLFFGGCVTTTVLRPADWPEGIEVLAAPPSAPPLAMIETLAVYTSHESCREELAKKAKELGATAIYVASESRSVGYALVLIQQTNAACRAFAYAAVSPEVTPAPMPAAPTTPPPVTTKARR